VRWAWLALLFLITAASAALAAGQPLARIVVHGDQPVLAGQQITVDVQILVPNFFMSAPEFPLFDMPGAIVTMPDDRGTNLVETIDGQDYSGIQKSYVITPQTAGELTFPPVEISFKYAVEPGKPGDGKVTLPPEKIMVKLPAGAAGPDGPVPLAHISITQSLDRDVQDLKAGDAVVRTVDIKAEGMPAMMIPPPAFAAPDGVRIYRKDPRLSDGQGDRQAFKQGERIETVTYVFEKPGDYVLPAVAIDWFDAAANKTETAKADEIKVTIAPGEAPAPALAPEQPASEEAGSPFDWRTPLAWIAVAAAIAAAAVLFVRRWLPHLRDWFARQRQMEKESEPAYFRQVEQAFATGDALTAYKALDRWTAKAGFKAIGGWAMATGDARLTNDVEALERCIFGRPGESGTWRDAAPMLERIAASRRASRAIRHRSALDEPRLPPLNPGSVA